MDDVNEKMDDLTLNDDDDDDDDVEMKENSPDHSDPNSFIV